MSKKRRRRFKRSYAEIPYRKLFVIATEGDKTEPQYFGLFNNQSSVVKVVCLRSKGKTSPQQVLKRMRAHLQHESLREGDEAWLVVDRDQWDETQIDQLFEWSQEEDSHGFALSNPMFELWLLLHFEDGQGVKTARDCLTRLRTHLPDYDKEIQPRRFPEERITAAISRARQRDNPPCDWPKAVGTTVYRLVENIRKAE